MGIHSGPAELRDGDYYGAAVNRERGSWRPRMVARSWSRSRPKSSRATRMKVCPGAVAHSLVAAVMTGRVIGARRKFRSQERRAVSQRYSDKGSSSGRSE